jgi:SAM-dependent methyltransferase
MSTQSHRSDPRVLNRRTLEDDHRVLKQFLRPGLSVLDVGCGTGAITAGIARAVERGEVVGVDRDAGLLDIARAEYAAIPNLSFERHDALSMDFRARFDIVTAARSLQWIANPADAVGRMASAAKAGGLVVALDYNHVRNAWSPTPPEGFVRFYDAFLAWRAANQWENEMADRLPALFAGAGLREIRTYVCDETAERGSDVAAIWTHVIASVGPNIVAAGFLTEDERLLAAVQYERYLADEIDRQVLCLRTVVGVAPGA